MTPDPLEDGPLRKALRQMFNSELDASLAGLKDYVSASPRDPLGHSFSAAVPFYHFVGRRLRPHGEGAIQDLILGKGIAVPPDIEQIGAALDRGRRLAESDLQAEPRDQNALLALCVVEGVERDGMGLVYNRWMPSLKHAQAASRHAQRLLEVNAQAYDAYYVIGLSEYVIGQVPALVRPFAKIPGIVGTRARAIQFLESAGRDGGYLRDFARQMLVTVYLEARRQQDAVRVLEGLSRDYAGNSGYREELERLRRANLE